MIYGITGKVGGGKTLYALSRMLDHFMKGGTCCTNIELDVDAIARYCWARGKRFNARQYVFLDMRRDPHFHRNIVLGIEGWHVLVFLDEAHLLFPAAEYRELRKLFLDIEAFVSQSRKVKVDIYLITQAWTNIWGQLTKQALFVIECRDMRVVQLPLFGKALGGVIGLSWSMKDTATNVVLESGRTKIAKDVCSCYSTFQVYDDMMEHLMKTLPTCQPFEARVGFWQRFFHRGPVLAVRDEVTTANVVIESPQDSEPCLDS
jgi:hypothetical protein